MKIVFGKLKYSKKYLAVLLPLIVLFLFFSPLELEAAALDSGFDLFNILGKTANAIQNTVIAIIGTIAMLLVYLVGKVLTIVVATLVSLAKYNDFISEPTIAAAWVQVRNFSNMFFILIMLVIAFATVLRIESYNFKKALPKVIIMAVLINFSKTICGLIIDVSQFLMLSFIQPIGTTGGSYIDALGVAKYLSLIQGEALENGLTGEVSFMSVVAGIILAMIFLVIATAVLLVILMTLVMRMVMLWIYVVLSPLAFMLFAFPDGQKYGSRWWEEFIKNVIVGPLLAFFLWLALLIGGNFDQYSSNFSYTEDEKAEAYGVVEMLKVENFLHFIISIGLLVGGLKVASDLGGSAGSAVSDSLNRVKKGGALAWAGTKLGTNYGLRKVAARTGVELRPKIILENIKESFAETEKLDNMQARSKAGQRFEKGGFQSLIGGLGAGSDGASRYLTGMFNSKGIKNAFSDVFFNRPGKITALEKERNTEIDSLKTKSGLPDLAGYQTIDEKDKKIKEMEIIKQEIKSIEEEENAGGISMGDDYNKELQAKKESLKKREVELNNDILKPVITADIRLKQEALDKQVAEVTKKFNDQISNIRPPVAYKSRLAERTLLSDEKKKAAEFKTSEELLVNFKLAVKDDNKYKVMAIAEQLADNGDLNELLKEYGYKSNAIGLNKFIQEGVIGGTVTNKMMKGQDQEALRFQNYLSDAAQKAGHWEFAKTVTVKPDGKLKSMIEDDDDSDHAEAAAGDMFKMDPQNLAKVSRLALGGEDENGEYKLSTAGMLVLKRQADAFVNHNKRVQPQTAARFLHLKSDITKLLADRGDAYIEKFFKAMEEAAGKQDRDLDTKKDIAEIRKAFGK